MPQRPGPTAREAEVTVLERRPGSPARVLVKFGNGNIRYAPVSGLRTLPPGCRRLGDDELRRLPWNEDRYGPDPMKQAGELFPQREVSA